MEKNWSILLLKEVNLDESGAVGNEYVGVFGPYTREEADKVATELTSLRDSTSPYSPFSTVEVLENQPKTAKEIWSSLF
jgi:hypothetical protein